MHSMRPPVMPLEARGISVLKYSTAVTRAYFICARFVISLAYSIYVDRFVDFELSSYFGNLSLITNITDVIEDLDGYVFSNKFIFTDASSLNV